MHDYSNTRRHSLLLIDLENFYLAREENWGLYDAGEFSNDLEYLGRFAAAIAGPRRITVRRAYANYNAARQASEIGRWDFFLQKAPKALMEHGVEPVQVFRFPGGGNKNAADMRLAMDASVFVSEDRAIEQCILVTGDADFIPLILDLKRRGIEVALIGVRGHTKAVLERYCDRFEQFESLVAAQEFEDGSSGDFEAVKGALHALLAQHQPLPFAALGTLLGKRLGRPFDAGVFDSNDAGDFARKFAEKLGVVIVQGAAGLEMRLPSAEFAESVLNDLTPLAPPIGALAAAEAAHTQHSPALYHKLLRFRRPNLHVLPREEWELITEAIYSLSVASDGSPGEIEHQKLLDGATELCEQKGVQLAYLKVNGTLFQVFKSGCFVCTSEGADRGRTDFHWGLSAKLNPEISSLEALRRRIRAYVVQSLKTRLESVGIESPIDVGALAAYIDGPNPSPQRVDDLRQLVAESAGAWAVGV